MFRTVTRNGFAPQMRGHFFPTLKKIYAIVSFFFSFFHVRNIYWWEYDNGSFRFIEGRAFKRRASAVEELKIMGVVGIFRVLCKNS